MDYVIYGLIWLLLIACIVLVAQRMWEPDDGDDGHWRDDYLDDFDMDGPRR
jgi:tryptophan-rich sensory protein